MSIALYLLDQNYFEDGIYQLMRLTSLDLNIIYGIHEYEEC